MARLLRLDTNSFDRCPLHVWLAADARRPDLSSADEIVLFVSVAIGCTSRQQVSAWPAGALRRGHHSHPTADHRVSVRSRLDTRSVRSVKFVPRIDPAAPEMPSEGRCRVPGRAALVCRPLGSGTYRATGSRIVLVSSLEMLRMRALGTPHRPDAAMTSSSCFDSAAGSEAVRNRVGESQRSCEADRHTTWVLVDPELQTHVPPLVLRDASDMCLQTDP